MRNARSYRYLWRMEVSSENSKVIWWIAAPSKYNLHITLKGRNMKKCQLRVGLPWLHINNGWQLNKGDENNTRPNRVGHDDRHSTSRHLEEQLDPSAFQYIVDTVQVPSGIHLVIYTDANVEHSRTVDLEWRIHGRHSYTYVLQKTPSCASRTHAEHRTT